MIKQYIIHRYY